MRKKITGPTSQQLIDSFPDPFVIIDRDYTIVTANARYASQYGVERSALVGKRCHKVSHHSDVPCSEHGEHCPLEELFRTGEATQVMHVHYDGHGNEGHVQINATPLFDEHGEMQFMGETIIPVRNLSTDEFLVGQSESMQLMIKQVQRVAPTKTTVLLMGESGTGKECLAAYLHRLSERAEKAFVIFDCAASGSGEELDRKIFGAMGPDGRGLAVEGVFQQADGGTLLIDEITELSLSSQLKLLRALECGEIQPVNGMDYQRVDVRVVVATHADLRQSVESGRLREDLYYRLSAFPVQVPPLRERHKDIIPLAQHFVRKFQTNTALRTMNKDFREALLAHRYPGNVRELRNLIERAVIYAAGGQLIPDCLVFDHQLFADDADAFAAEELDEHTRKLVKRRGAGPEDAEVLRVLKACGGHRSKAAEQLGISERTLYRYLRKFRDAS